MAKHGLRRRGSAGRRPATASTNLPYYIYQRAFQGFDIGQSSGMGVIVVILTLIVATFALRLRFRAFDVSKGVVKRAPCAGGSVPPP